MRRDMMNNIPEPLNATEMYLHAMTIRLDALVHQMSGVCECLSKLTENGVETNTIKEEIAPVRIDSTESESTSKKKGARKKKAEVKEG